MKISRKLKMDLNKVAVITIGYLLINIFLFFFNYAIINSPYSLGPSSEFSAKSYLLTSLVSGLVTGVLSGILLVSVNNQLFRRRSFKFAMFTTLIAYVLIFLLVTIASSIAYVIGQEGLQGISFDFMKITLGNVFASTLMTRATCSITM